MQTLILLLKHAESDRDDAHAAFRRMSDAMHAAQRQLEQLTHYRRDYEARWNAQFSNVGRMELVRCYQEFMERLNQVVDQQQRAVRLAMQQQEQALRTLRERELRVASVGKMIERRCHEIRIGNDRREQKELDELAARAARHGALGSAFAITHQEQWQ